MTVYTLLLHPLVPGKAGPILQVYEVDLMNAEQEGDILGVPIPTSR